MQFDFAGAMLKNSLIVAQVLLLSLFNCALADEEFPEERQTEEYTGTVTSIDAFNSTKGNRTGISLQMAAEYATSHENIDQAIKISKLAVEQDPDDIDTHMRYAQALEEKLKMKPKKDRDQSLLDECITEWLIVYRCEAGDERGASFHGINPLGHLYQDEERSIPARHHIVSLVGRAPKPWETDAKFLNWVNRPSEQVAGKLISNKSGTTATSNSNSSTGESESQSQPRPDKLTKTITDYSREIKLDIAQ
jgi:hypothetical protein